MAGGIIEKGPNVSWSWDCFAEEGPNVSWSWDCFAEEAKER